MTAKAIAKADRFIRPIDCTNLTPGASDLGAHEFLALYAGCPLPSLIWSGYDIIIEESIQPQSRLGFVYLSQNHGD
jgi:hypothetical protein